MICPRGHQDNMAARLQQLELTVAVNVKDDREPLEMCLGTTAPALRGDT